MPRFNQSRNPIASTTPPENMNQPLAQLILIACVAGGLIHPPLVAQTTVLWHARPAAKWAEALQVGNGRLGAMAVGLTQMSFASLRVLE
jgi:hypothetical protein